MMQIISDVHLDLNKIDDFASILTPSADYLAILGDVGFHNIKRGLDFMSYCSTNFKQVFLVLGNHDYYSDECSMKTPPSILNVYYINAIPHKVQKAPRSVSPVAPHTVAQNSWPKAVENLDH
jgi:predicted phosphodiesterase